MTRYFFLSCILILGLLLRFFHLGVTPPGLNRDEAAIGYTAYSLLQTGKDEYGRLFPFSIESFGDWKLPLFIYLDIFSIALFSLSEFSVRFPSAMYGTLTILVVYFLISSVFSFQKTRVALTGALFVAVSPWHVHFSRVAAEANLSILLVSLTLVLFFHGVHRMRRMYIFFSSLVLSASLFTYHGNHVFSVLLFFFLTYLLFRSFRDRYALFGFLLLFLIPAFFIFKITLVEADATKLSGLSPVYDPFLRSEYIHIPRADHTFFSPLVGYFMHNKVLFSIDQFLGGYLRSFDPSFLVLRGGGNSQHNIPGFGNMYIWEFPFFLLGLYFLFSRTLDIRWFCLYWVLVSPIGASLTKDAPHSARMSVILPSLHLISSFGFILFFLRFPRKRFVSVFASILVFPFVFNIFSYLDTYYVHFPLHAEDQWGGGYRELVSYLKQSTPEGYEIVMDRPSYSPYIYFLFYSRVDPEIFQNTVLRYPVDSEGFHHVRYFENITYRDIDWADDFLIPNRLLVSWADSTPSSATHGAVLITDIKQKELANRYQHSFGLMPGDVVERFIEKVIYLQNRTPQFYVIRVRQRETHAVSEIN